MTDNCVFTVGYGNRSLLDLVDILNTHDIEYLIDVRSHPFSKFNPEYNKPDLISFFEKHRINYLFWGYELGGTPDNPDVKSDGIVVYSSIMELDSFKEKVGRIADAYNKGIRVCLMCSELAPENCHRSKLIGVALHDIDIHVLHIDKDGTLVKHLDVLSRVDKSQPSLFENNPYTSRKRY